MVITMSNNFDDLNKYINSQLTVQDNNNRNLTQGRVKLGESAVISVVVAGINWLVDRSQIDRPTANFIKASTNIIATLAKSWFGLL